MTTDLRNPAESTHIRAVKDRAIDWLERSERADFGEEDGRNLEQWLSESPEHRVAFWRVKNAWARADRLQILNPPRRMAAQREPRRFRPLLARSAAAIGILGLVGATALWMSAPEGRTLATGHGEHEIVSLADGSKIELNTDTELRIDVRADHRRAELVRGEAYFQIEHDAARPFTVIAGEHRIRDLGTKFLVQKSTNSLRVALVEGRAQLEGSAEQGDEKPVVLAPGDVALATADLVHVTRKPANVLADDLAWRHGGLVFHNSSLAEAVAQFNRYGSVKLVIADPHAAKLTINGAFRTNGAENFAGVAHEVFGLSVRRQDNTIVLSR